MEDCGIGRIPPQPMAINKAWFTAVLIAAMLLTLDGALARAEPKTLRRYRILLARHRPVQPRRSDTARIRASWARGSRHHHPLGTHQRPGSRTPDIEPGAGVVVAG